MRHTRMRAVVAATALTALTGCTPAQLAQWMEWHASDPEAAVAYANLPEVQAQLQQATEAATQPAWSVNWDRVAWCESGGNWGHGPVSNRSGTYSGGLMIGHQWWPKFGGGQFASAPYQATKSQQIVVAERIVDDVGFDRGWQCDG